MTLPRLDFTAIRIGALISGDRDSFFALFILAELTVCVLLWSNGTLDLAVAICQSAALLAAAHLFAKQRLDTGDAVVAGTQAAVPAVEADVPAATGGPSRIEPPVRTAIDEQSQTWADLMARISHEIRTPLNAVIGFSELMGREVYGPLGHDRYRDYLAHIRDSGEALLRSAEDTLALSSMLAAPSPDQRPQSTPLASLAADAWLLVEPHAARRNVRLAIAVPATLEVAGDRRALRQALANLMMEASERSKEGIAIAITAWAQDDAAVVEIGAKETEARRLPNHPSLPVCVARALLELQGNPLRIADCQQRAVWQATTALDLALQPDFFSGFGRG